MTTLQGDVIAVMFGMNIPLVLRPVGGDYYQIVGEAYVHGIMDGEVMKDSHAGQEFKIKGYLLQQRNKDYCCYILRLLRGVLPQYSTIADSNETTTLIRTYLLVQQSTLPLTASLFSFSCPV